MSNNEATGPHLLRETLADIRRIAAAILQTAEQPDGRMSAQFTEAKIQAVIDACLKLSDAVRSCRASDLRAAKDEMRETEALVIAADDALAVRVPSNPEAVSFVKSVELVLFNLMRSGSFLILLFARIAQTFRSYLSSYLHKELFALRLQLLAEEGQADASGKILDVLAKVNRNQLLSHKLERLLLRKYEDGAADGAPSDDARHTTPLRASMVQLTALRVFHSPAGEAGAIKFACFNAYRTIPGSYDKFNSFRRAVDRLLGTYLA